MIVALSLSIALLAAEPEKPKEPVPPKIVLASPLAIVPGTKVRIAFRGAGLDEPKEVRTSAKDVVLKIASKGKVVVPQEYTADRIGDTQTEVDLEVPKNLPPGEVEFEIETAAGMAKRKLKVLAVDKAAWDDGSNNGFRDAKIVEPGRTVIGLINEARDVDVYRVELNDGKTLVGRLDAGALGSPLAPAVTIYDGHGHLLAAKEGAGQGGEVELRIAGEPGPIYVVVYDANDRGGVTHAYLLTLDVK